LDDEIEKTNDEVRRVIGTIIRMNERLIRLETFEEMRTGNKPPPRIENK
jgi:hypothetical protein